MSEVHNWLAKVTIVCFLLGQLLADTNRVCDVTKDPDVKYFDIRLPETRVPQQLTTYICQAQPIPLPMDSTYHAVAFEPIIANKHIMHHMILFGCPTSVSNEPHACGSVDNACRSFLVQWSMGIDGQICSYPNTGVRFGLGSFQSLSLQIHWNNAKITDGMSDSSGIRVYYTSRLRKFDAANIQVGQNNLQIPPRSAHFPQSGSCSSDCTREWMKEPIFLTRAHIHMHYVGDGGVLELVRNGHKIQTIVNDTEFDYNNPPSHNFNSPVEVLPGDELKLTCYYNTKDWSKFRNRTLYWNEGSDGEMCYAFITYFPQVSGFDQCVQFNEHDICTPNGAPGIGGCIFEVFVRSFKTVMASEILKYCGGKVAKDTRQRGENLDLGSLCSEKCDRAVKKMTDHPCMQNGAGQQVRRVYLPTVDSWEEVKLILDSNYRYCSD